MNTESDLLPRFLLGGFLLLFWFGAMWLICHRSTWRDVPAGTPMIFVPFVVLLKAYRRLRRSQRIAAFVQLAAHIRMRQQRVDGVLPRGPGR